MNLLRTRHVAAALDADRVDLPGDRDLAQIDVGRAAAVEPDLVLAEMPAVVDLAAAIVASHPSAQETRRPMHRLVATHGPFDHPVQPTRRERPES